MGQDPEEVKRLYDTVAEEYAREFFREHDKKPRDQEMLQRFAQEVAGRGPVWDFGCGPGQTTEYLSNLGVKIGGLDLSERLIDQARKAHRGIDFRPGNILDLEFKDDSIAAIVAFYAIVHFSPDQVERAFCEIFRVLQPDGLFLFTYHIGEETIHVDTFLGRAVDIDFMFFRTDSISRSLQGCGFEKVETIESAPYPGVEDQSRRAYVFARKPSKRE
jgi:ubiquinone/menaquinone biosynthesis C-methylase UbiE